MSMKPVRKFLKPIMDWVSEIQLVGKPLWIVFGPIKDKVKAEQIRQVMAVARAGDLVFRRQGRAIGTMVIPGHFSHVGVLKTKDTIIHAVGDGVKEDDLLDFLRTDEILVLRVGPPALRRKAVKVAIGALGKPYDYLFDSDDKRAIYCFELAMLCYPSIVPERMQKQDAVTSEDLLSLEGVEVLFDSRTKQEVKKNED